MISRWPTALVAAVFLVACGGGADRTKTHVRLVNASTAYAALDLGVAGQAAQTQVGYGASANYVDVDPGSPTATLASSGSATAILSFTPSLSKGQYDTVLAYGAQGALAQLLLDDNSGAPADGQVLLRVVNAAPDAGTLDVYLTGSGDALASSVPVQAGAALGAASAWLTVSSATWRLRVTAAGSKADLRLDLSGVVLANRQVATLVLTPGRGGVLVNALLLTQQGGITRLDGTQARVRVAAGVADGGAVSAIVAGAPLMSGVGSPAVGLYALVSAGIQPLAVTVNGAALTTPAQALVAGSDYTLLVYGPLAAAQASWIEDDNTMPTQSGTARVRLINGVAGLATPLAMTADFVPVADSVAAGAASPYASIAGTTTANLSITTSGVAAPLFSATLQTFVAGSTYSVFAVGSATATVGILRKDR
jgi:hypothetical protein